MTSTLRPLPSFSQLLEQRASGLVEPSTFATAVSRKRTPTGLHTSQRFVASNVVTTLDLFQSRFLLAGSKGGSVSIYDLSRKGSEDSSSDGFSHRKKRRPGELSSRARVHKPVQQAHLQSSGSIVRAQWYSDSDSGIFLSAASSAVHIWDANEMVPVLEVTPYTAADTANVVLTDMQVSPHDFRTVAVTCSTSTSVKLMDLHSGATSQSLSGHTRGVNVVAWSPHAPHQLASGDITGTVRLWDVRKTGSRACLSILQTEQEANTRGVVRPYRVDGSHWKVKKRSASHSPNDYRAVQAVNSAALSSGPVRSLVFDPEHPTLITVIGREMKAWDLTQGPAPTRLDTRWSGDSGQPPIDVAGTAGPRLPMKIHSDILWTRVYQRLVGYNLSGGKPQHVLSGHLGKVNDFVMVSPSMELISSGDDGLILMWASRPSNVATSKKKRHRVLDRDTW